MKEKFLNDKLNNMSLSEKIGQMIMIDYRGVTEMDSDLEKLLTKYHIGGFVVFKSNVENYKQLKKLVRDIKDTNDIKTMVAVDQEGGRVQRLDERVDIIKYPSMMEVGNTNDLNYAFELGVRMGLELSLLGIDINMAPVLDVFSNPKNTVIGDRSFGSDKEIVINFSLAYAAGLNEAKIIAVGKHFPGHGDTFKDSHVELPVVLKDLKQMKELELLPFAAAIKNNISGLMVGHIAVPKITGNLEPASLSKTIVSDLLRGELGYNGIVMPDSLKMKALDYDNSEIYGKCILAGNDLLLMPNNIEAAYNTLYRCVNDGKISEEQINSSVMRILNVKFDRGLFDTEYQQYIKRKIR